MRKKKMLMQMRDMLDQNSQLEQRLRTLESETEMLRARAADLEKQLEEARALQATVTEPVTEERPADPVPEMTAIAPLPPTAEPVEEFLPETKAEPKTAPIVTDDGTIDVAALARLPVNKEMQYATEAIGAVVVACAAACNEFAEHGGSAARELINLALGRTEVFKADCLTIATSNNTFAVKKECIDRIRTDTEDYFKGLKAQHFE